MKAKRKELILGMLLVATAVALWQNLGSGGGATGPGGPGGPGPVARVKLEDIRLPGVNWAALTAPRPAYDPSGRNIFTWGAIPVPTPPPLTPEELKALEKARLEAEAARKAAEEAAAKAAKEATDKAAEEQVRIASLPPPPPPKPVPPAITYKFIGYVGPSENKIAILYDGTEDRKSTRLNSSHLVISYAVFCLKKKKARSRCDPQRVHRGRSRSGG